MEVLSSRILLRPADLGRSRRFYRDVLGLAVYREFGPPEDPGMVFFLGSGLLEVSGRADGPPGRLGDDLAPGAGCSRRARTAGCGRSPYPQGARRGALGIDRNVDRGPGRPPHRAGRGSGRSSAPPRHAVLITAEMTAGAGRGLSAWIRRRGRRPGRGRAGRAWRVSGRHGFSRCPRTGTRWPRSRCWTGPWRCE